MEVNFTHTQWKSKW